MNEAITIKEAAEKYGLTLEGIYRLIREGKLYKLKQDGKTLLSCAALESIFFAVCPVCGDGFRKGNQRQKFCSQSCRQKASRRKK